jgi:hypothetical protein
MVGRGQQLGLQRQGFMNRAGSAQHDATRARGIVISGWRAVHRVIHAAMSFMRTGALLADRAAILFRQRKAKG